MKRSLLFFALVLASYGTIQAQVTTSSVTGTVTQSSGQATPGATIRAVHTPSGTTYSSAANDAGRFNLANMRVGGPYRIEVTYVGQDPVIYENVYLQLGQPFVLNAVFTDGSRNIEEVAIASGQRINTARTGASTSVGLKQLNELPQVNRSVTEFTRLTPQANGNSFAGRDARYNNLQIDGANFNNGFGLSTNPLPGGNSQPISLDAIEEISVNIAPFDVTQSGFTGAGINAVTRSGTNRVEGSAYYYLQNQDIQGRRIGDVTLDRIDAAKRNYGFRLGGPIIKDKLFLFVNAEREEATGGNASGSNPWRASENGTAVPEENIARTTRSDLEAVRQHLINQWGWDPGRYEGYADEARESSTKFLARLDWNIDERHKLAVRYNQVVGTSMQGANGNSGPFPRSQTNRISQNSITFENGNYAFRNVVRSLTAELNSNINSRLNNQFLATYTRIQDTRTTPSNQLFPFVDIGDGTHSNINSPYVNYMSFGTELFSYNNDVINNNYSFINNLTLSADKHTFTFGAAFEIQNFGNSFTRLGTSYYRYASVEDFLTTGSPNEVAPIMFGLTYPYEGQDTYSRINFGLASLYAQDRWTVTDQLTITYGIRAELPIYMNKLTANPSIDAMRLLDVNGMPTNYNSGLWPKSQLLVSPRFGVNYDVFGDRSLVLRGGTGFFSGRVPFVWLTNMPTGAGVLQNTIEPGSYADVAGWIGNVRFNPDPYYHLNNVPQGAENVFISTPREGAPSSFALVDRNFKMPMVWRTSIGGDYKIPNTPVTVTGDFLYTRDINAVFQFGANRASSNTFLNYGSSGEEGDFGDNRTFYPNGVQRFNPLLGANNATVLTNTNVKGHALSATIGLNVPYYQGFSGGIFYTYSDAREVSANAGSSASSAWGGSPNINGPNDQILHPSAFAIPHRLVGNLSYRYEYANSLATTVGIVYTGSSQGRFSYVYTSFINGDGASNDLIYLPRDLNSLNFVDRVDANGQLLFTAAEQREALSVFIAENGLEKYQGGYLPRNGFLMPWLNRFDVRVLQDIYKNIGPRRHTLQLSAEVINFGNLISKSSGIQSRLNNAQFLYGNNLIPGVNNQGQPVLNTQRTPQSGIPEFNMNVINGELPITPFQNASNLGTTWQMQLGIRYIF
ncbi:TonB-dependent receptor [Sphingobacterium corticibacter]|uniref:Cell envelope biogenesis protein OmpA n=1 Tax=Sphingobacterium corticibacter TaxID=2171749 RepID=A0A2T8HPB1_9SPHI|nr:carboxypeptidase regulatory-like domain-containing protein [Sphingobacterium corticibacter]PVH27122.1 cell envelope biogenesis protein OmpA [Sphingobacterium corticibacter]